MLTSCNILSQSFAEPFAGRSPVHSNWQASSTGSYTTHSRMLCSSRTELIVVRSSSFRVNILDQEISGWPPLKEKRQNLQYSSACLWTCLYAFVLFLLLLLTCQAALHGFAALSVKFPVAAFFVWSTACLYCRLVLKYTLNNLHYPQQF